MREGDVISLDGTTGEVVLGEVALVTAEPPAEFDTILGWADEIRKGKLGVRANADTARTPPTPAQFGAEGIGLCRTEHMFLGDRLPVVRRMILADTPEEETAALEELRVVQKADFEEILEAMDGLPVTVRLLDPPLHEFLPDIEELRDQAGDRRASTPRSRSCSHAAEAVARVQPDARHPRRAPRRPQARPLRDAGAGADGGRGRAAQARAATRSSRS